MSNRLDHSQEGLELRRAVWAGFVKSRYWRIRGRIELHAVIGAFILCGTLLYGGLYIGLLLVQKRLPSPTTLNVFFAAIGLPSLWYVVHPNRGLLRRFWENPWGKLFYSLVAAFTVTLSKAGTDQIIRLLTKSNPSLFPSAQPLIAVLIIVTMTPILIGFFLILISIFMYSKAYLSSLARLVLPEGVFHFKEMLGLPNPRQTFRSRMTWVFAYLWSGVFVFTVINDFNTIIPFNPMEELLLWSSFIPNGSTASDRICFNLRPGTFVSPFDTRTPVPNEVLMAEQIPTGPDGSGRSYTYRVVPCLKSNPLGPPDIGSSTATGAMAPNGRAPAADTAAPRVRALTSSTFRQPRYTDLRDDELAVFSSPREQLSNLSRGCGLRQLRVNVSWLGSPALFYWAWAPIWLPELFPTRMRGTVVAFCFNAPRWISCVGPLIAGTLVVGLGAYRPAATLVGLFFILGVVAAPFLPETRGKPLPEALPPAFAGASPPR